MVWIYNRYLGDYYYSDKINAENKENVHKKTLPLEEI